MHAWKLVEAKETGSYQMRNSLIPPKIGTELDGRES